jgi:hypothetical protein
MKMQMDLLSGEKKRDPDPMAVFGKVIAEHLVTGVKDALNQAPSVAKRHLQEVVTDGKVLIGSGTGD